MKFSRTILVVMTAACTLGVGAHSGAPDDAPTERAHGGAPLQEAKAAFEENPSAHTHRIDLD